jgi:hypothetical protein
VIRTTLAFAVTIAVSPACTQSESASERTQRLATAEGHALLDAYVETIRLLAQSGSVEPFLEALAEHEERAHGLQREGKLDAAFLDRHRRLVEVTRLMITPPPDDATRRVNAARLTAFARDVDGPSASAIEPNGGLSAIAPLLVEEVLNLHMLLEGETDREKARAKWIGSAATP